MTLVSALAGLAMGPGSGFVVGALAAGVYSVGSPYGVALPPILVAQVLGMAIAGVSGGLLGPRLGALGSARRQAVAAGALGALTALIFDLITNLAIWMAYDTPLATVAAMAVTMFLVHVVVNTVVFALVVPAVAQRLRNLVRGGLVGRGAALALVPGACLGLVLVGPVSARAGAPADSLALIPVDSLQ
ncbi:hypothetical protein DRQ50_04665, partial [bacterium]